MRLLDFHHRGLQPDVITQSLRAATLKSVTQGTTLDLWEKALEFAGGMVGWGSWRRNLCKSHCSWCNNVKWTIKLIEMWRQILLFSSASSISHHTSHKDSSSFTIYLSEIHSGASLLVTTSALGAFGPWPYGLQLLYRGPPADAQALCAALKVCQEQRWIQGAASHWVSVRISCYFMGKINKLVNG